MAELLKIVFIRQVEVGLIHGGHFWSAKKYKLHFGTAILVCMSLLWRNMTKLALCYSSPEHLYVNYLKITKKLHNLILDIKDVFWVLPKIKLHKKYFLLVLCACEGLYYYTFFKGSKNRIGTKLRKQFRWQALALVELHPLG